MRLEIFRKTVRMIPQPGSDAAMDFALHLADEAREYGRTEWEEHELLDEADEHGDLAELTDSELAQIHYWIRSLPYEHSEEHIGRYIDFEFRRVKEETR